ncbi:poly [ADP-ribose] polymerase [Pectinophora gossypiella]|uniref:poly [ADP-ribose] polymerase n=1 Tax=Pectinophora gossypiella TaxID=13191 RepID=UPI00214F0323|nr:poly [ADP-ribose] polymerase [Pectinophora gossypiella]
MDELPFQVEYAKSGRASCKGCKQKIDQGCLRIAVMVQSAFYDGKQPNWHHEDCFFQRQRVQCVSDIANFNKLKNADKDRIKKTIESNVGVVLPVEKGKGKKKRAAESSSNTALKDFKVEYSKSSRATCKHCDIKICKDEIRVCKIMYDTEVGMKYGGQPFWHHVQCFNEERDTLGYMAGGEDLPGFNLLKKDDQKIVKEAIKPKSLNEIPIKKLKAEPKDEEEIKKEKDHEKQLEKQNKLYHKYRSALSELKKADLHELLEYNSQETAPGFDECLDHLADCMAFGVPDPCPECKGQLILDTFNYKCTGNISEWTKCSYKIREPTKKPFKVPKAYKDGSIFKKYKSKVATRLFDAAPPPPQIIIKKEEPVEKKDIKIPPLKNLQFFIYGKVKSKEDVKKRILKLGGLVVSKLTETLAAVVSTKKDIDNMPRKMAEIQEEDIEVVDESFLDLIDPDTGTVAKTLELIKLHNIADWGSDPAKRVPQDVIDGKSIPKSGSLYVKSQKSTTTKLKIKGGTAIDPDSGLEDEAHVYKDMHDGTMYTVVLCKTDVIAQKNSYYKLQLLEADNRKKYWLFRSWGRIGTTIGGHKLEDCKSLDDAMKRFEDLYMEKTENPWECRDDFMKVPNAYYPIEVDYGDDPADVKQELKVDEKCKLPLPVQRLVVKIFDINIMKKTLLEFELDTEKMPLGKLSKKQIKSGYKVLTELLAYIETGKASESKIIDATNRFFTTVPHDFGVNNAPLLNNVEAIKKKAEMLDNLMEIEIAYSLLKTDSDDATIPVEAHYTKLKAHIEPMDRNSEEFKLISEYTKNTHAATHSSYTLEIEEVFKVVREGEDKRYKPFKKLHNRRLLWHGSRVTNFAGILSQGLRIAPPEAPVTGYMFGKGIYFADMVSKSANYCCTNKSNPTGIMLLCEVALGDMRECRQSEMITKLPAGQHSTWGIGRTQPDPKMNRVLDDGTIVPLGKPVQNKGQTSLLYNEFIVYDVAQVNVKYLLQMRFNHMY